MPYNVRGKELVAPRFVVKRGEQWIYERSIPPKCRRDQFDTVFQLTLSVRGNDTQDVLDAKAKTASDMYQKLIESSLARNTDIAEGAKLGKPTIRMRYLLWVESPQGWAPYYQRMWPKHIADQRREAGHDIKWTKRLGCSMHADAHEIAEALDDADVEFINMCFGQYGGMNPPAPDVTVKNAPAACVRKFDKEGKEAIVWPTQKPKRTEEEKELSRERALATASSNRVQKAVSTLTKFFRHPEAPYLISKGELVVQSSKHYRKDFRRCSSEERDEVLATLQSMGLIELCELGQITNLTVSAGSLKRSDRGHEERLSGKNMYLISNPEMPGWLKNGESTRLPERRANDMKTHSPSDYVVERSYRLPEGMSDTDFHPFMEKVAGGSNREWFFMPQEVAEQVIKAVMEGNEHLIDTMPKCEPPSVLGSVRFSFSDVFRARQRQQQQKEVLYDADFLAFS
jgi:hypothetical protein